MSKTAYVTQTDGSEPDERFDNLYLERMTDSDKKELIIVFNACSEQYVERIIDKYPLIVPIENTGNRMQKAEALNLGLRYAFKKGYDAVVRMEGIAPGVRITQEAMTAVGFLSPNFYLTHIWLDYVLRCKTFMEGFHLPVSDFTPVIPQIVMDMEMSGESQWDQIKFGSCWAVPETFQSSQEVWDWCLKTKHKWDERIYVA